MAQNFLIRKEPDKEVVSIGAPFDKYFAIILGLPIETIEKLFFPIFLTVIHIALSFCTYRGIPFYSSFYTVILTIEINPT
jgi:hypothetical protein